MKEGGAVSEGGKPVAQVQRVKAIRREGDRAVFAVEAGSYAFEAAW